MESAAPRPKAPTLADIDEENEDEDDAEDEDDEDDCYETSENNR